MEWTRAIDAYCERMGPDFWAEPVNALTNLAFFVAAAILWPRVTGIGRVLCVLLVVIGLGSFLFHTLAQAWAGLADVLPILGYVLVYIYAANRDFWGMRRWPAFGLTLLFFPYAAATVPLFSLVPGIGGSAAYAPVPLLILIYAALLRLRAPVLARGLALGAGILIVSLTFRSLDGPLCGVVPGGTHFAWHLLNATMLGWMIEVWRRHTLAGGAGAR